jgi:hypothetical protein
LPAIAILSLQTFAKLVTVYFKKQLYKEQKKHGCN